MDAVTFKVYTPDGVVGPCGGGGGVVVLPPPLTVVPQAMGTCKAIPRERTRLMMKKARITLLRFPMQKGRMVGVPRARCRLFARDQVAQLWMKCCSPLRW